MTCSFFFEGFVGNPTTPLHLECWIRVVTLFIYKKSDIKSLENVPEKSGLELMQHQHHLDSIFVEANLGIALCSRSTSRIHGEGSVTYASVFTKLHMCSRRRTWMSINVLQHITDNHSSKVHQLIKCLFEVWFWWFKDSYDSEFCKERCGEVGFGIWCVFWGNFSILAMFLVLWKALHVKFVTNSWWNGMKF